MCKRIFVPNHLALSSNFAGHSMFWDRLARYAVRFGLLGGRIDHVPSDEVVSWLPKRYHEPHLKSLQYDIDRC